MSELIKGRECGTCTVCCQDLMLDEPELKKLPGEVCSICHVGEGCSLYASRPATCRDWVCGWRLLPLDDEWRPDLSQILILPTGVSRPVWAEEGLEFKMIGDPMRVMSEPFVVLIERLINNGTPVYLSAPPRALGVHSMRTHLNANEVFREAAAKKDYENLAALLASALQAVMEAQPEEVAFKS